MVLFFFALLFFLTGCCFYLLYLVSSLHWLIPGFLYALFTQWSVFATIKEPSLLSAQSGILQLWHFVPLYLTYTVQPKEMQISVSIGTFLTNYDVTNRKLQQTQCTPLYENKQFESKIIQWRLLGVTMLGSISRSPNCIALFRGE